MKTNILNIQKLTILIILLTVSQALKAQCNYYFPMYVSFGCQAGYQYIDIEPEGWGCPSVYFTGLPSWVAINHVGGNSYTVTVYSDNTTGSTRSATGYFSGGSITIQQAPFVVVSGTIAGGTSQPMCPGQSVPFLYVIPSGGSGNGYTYQWFKSDGTALTGISSSSNFYPGAIIQATSYFCRVYNSMGTGDTPPKTITVHSPLSVTITGGASVVCYNTSPGQMTANPSGGNGIYTYQWYNGNSPVSGATSKTYTPPNLTATTNFSCVVTNDCGSETSNTRSVTVFTVSSISGGTTPICSGAQPGTLSVVASGSGSPSYQWQKSENNGSWTNISGATSSTYMLPVLTQSTSFRCTITDNNSSCGTVTSAAKEIVVNNNPTATDIKSRLFVNQGATIYLTSGGGTSYSWTGPDGYTSTSQGPSRTNATLSMMGTYTVTVKNSFNCSVTASTEVIINEFNFSSDKNYIFQKEFTSESGISGLTAGQARNSVTYFDGLGRMEQAINIKASPNQNDIVTPVEYDQFGRENLKYLPYEHNSNYGSFKTNALDLVTTAGSQRHWYNTLYPGETPYAETVFEASPLNRVLKQGAPGTAWQPASSGDHVARFEYGANTAGDNVILWKISGDNLTRTNTSSYYSVGSLYKNIVKDENWVSGNLNTTEEFTNFAGQTVLTRRYVENGSNVEKVDTYYIYDDLGLLRYVLSPEAVNNLASLTTLNKSSAPVKNYGYYYKYDARKRLIEKQLPGADPVFFAYDKRDRLVAMQDGNMRAATTNGQWMITKYDVLNRPAITALYAPTANMKTQADMQNAVDTYYAGSSPSYFVTPASPGTHGYTTVSFPNGTTGLTYYTVTYYDDYSFDGAKPFDDNTGINYNNYHNFHDSPATQRFTPRFDNSNSYTYEITDGVIIHKLTVVNASAIPSGSFGSYINCIFKISEPMTAGRYTLSFDYIANVVNPSVSFFSIPVSVIGTKQLEPTTVWKRGFVTCDFTGTTDSTARVQFENGYDSQNGQYFYIKNIKIENVDNVAISNPKGLVTGTKTLVLDGAGTYLTATTHYDKKYRPIQTIRELYNDTNTGLETVSNEYSFIGELLQSRIRQKFTTVDRIVHKTYTYDHAGRLTKIDQQIDSNSPVTLATLEYNEIGQLIKENLHVNTSNSTALQAVDYKYNIRGWLTDINDVTNKGTDLFAMQLLYNNPTGMGSLTASAQYNGNVSAVKWMQSSDNTLKAYAFTYDGLDRMKAANYADGSALTANVDRFKEEIGSYDLNGNILSLNRSGVQNSTFYSNLDQLTYTYTGNRLMKIVDAGQKSYGFIDNIPTTDDYEYDGNGNLKKDNNKGITDIKYNYLNLPEEVIKDANNKAVFIYDAAGNKVKTIMTNGGTSISRYYAGIMEYKDNKTLDFIYTDKGLAFPSGGTYSYEYHLKDHLGNTRAAFQSGTGDNQFINYYPFGMISERSTNGAIHNRRFFGGKEFLEDNIGGNKLNWSDFGARMLDNGRWTTPDPLAERGYEWSGYNYAFNNPMRFVDLDGRWPGEPFKNQREAAADFGKIYNGMSILSGLEYGSSIYPINIDGKRYYTYTEPNIGERANEVDPSMPPSGSERTAMVHTHGKYSRFYDRDNFSRDPDTDIDYFRYWQIDGYVATPSGTLREYNVKTGKDEVVSNEMPSDPKHPNRVNNINPIGIDLRNQETKTLDRINELFNFFNRDNQ